MDIQLNFINDSNDTNNTQVLIFSKNVTPGSGEESSAWTIIKNCGIGSNHPFVYPAASTIGYLDSYGNFTQRLPADPGQCFEAVLSKSGDTIQPKGAADLPNTIELVNSLGDGQITGEIYKEGRIFASAPGISPGAKAVFELEPKLWIGTLSQMNQDGAPISVAVSQDNTEISLLGIASADIVMTGGGAGNSFAFTLQNVVMA